MRVAEAPSVQLTIVAGGSGVPNAPRRDALARGAGARAIRLRTARHRHRPGDDHLHLRLHGLPEGRDDDARATSSPRPNSITTYLENTSDDVILNVLPISFDYGLYQVLMAMKLGATLVLEKSFVFPQAVFDRMMRRAGHRLPARADHGGAHPADARPAARQLPRPPLHHQHSRGACRRRTSRGCVSSFPASASIRCTA